MAIFHNLFLQEIEYAEQNMGDYKLKYANDHVIPPELRVSTAKRRSDIILLR